MHDKIVPLGSRLHYPIIVTKLLKKPGDAIKKQESIFEYKFHWKRKVNEETWNDETTYTEFDSPAEGKLKQWRIREGQEIAADSPCLMVEEACGHEVQVQGLCSLCGADMTEINWASDNLDTDRAMINMSHDQTVLRVSESVATKAEHENQKRLLRQRKLSLVVDLDQTIIHACIEPTIGEWKNDPTNPNYEAVKDVRDFQLNDDGPRGLTSGCTYYIKLRPGLMEFLDEVSKMYELHVYTMGTRAYALNIAKIVDPDQKLFGNRVISRDENGSITAKSLQRLFPVSTDMVVIIDDRADVWPMNRPNLIKVVPYDFFKGIGDINSSFLPKRTDILPILKSKPVEKGVKIAPKASPMDEIARMSGGDDAASLKVQEEEQEKTLEKQIKDRPLLHMQEELDKEDDQQETNVGENASESPHVHHRNVLVDDDEELIALQDHLTDLHTAFYETYDRRRAEEERKREHTHLRIASLSEGHLLTMASTCPWYRMSAIFLTNSKESEIGMQAQSYGAQVLDTVSKRVTHLVVASSRPRTKKVQQAAKIPSIKIVNQNWLTDCLSQWRRLDERPYFLEILDADREKGGDDTTEVTSEADEAEDAQTGQELRDFDWGEAEDELAEFLDDDVGDDGDVSIAPTVTESDVESVDGQNSKGIKRKADADESDDDGSNLGESVLAKKQRLARNRGASGLRSIQTPNGDDQDTEDGSLPTPVPTGDEAVEDRDKEPLVNVDDGADFDEDELERELLAELMAD
ncbi:FCP1 homology domain [Fusarium oxysporum f. sp. vasinfectum]|nr:FCP1 homology domain [Fusarium oxysporum f. sp. vasinfectum]